MPIIKVRSNRLLFAIITIVLFELACQTEVVKSKEESLSLQKTENLSISQKHFEILTSLSTNRNVSIIKTANGNQKTITRCFSDFYEHLQGFNHYLEIQDKKVDFNDQSQFSRDSDNKITIVKKEAFNITGLNMSNLVYSKNLHAGCYSSRPMP